MRSTYAVFSVMGLLLLAQTASGKTPNCDALNPSQKQLVEKLLAKQYPHDCCDDTLANCLKEKPVCRLAVRLKNNICRRVAAKQPEQKIVRGLSRRARSMMSAGKKATIDLNKIPKIGQEGSPVVLVEYACGRCPYCSKLTPLLVDAIETGPLKGKAILYFKAFPIRSHEFSKEVGLGFVAAANLGKFWEFALLSYSKFDQFCIKKQADWAREAGLEPEEFDRVVKAPETRKILVENKKEGLRNKVDATPTFFINGRKFVGDIELNELIDALEEEFDRVGGLEYSK